MRDVKKMEEQNEVYKAGIARVAPTVKWENQPSKQHVRSRKVRLERRMLTLQDIPEWT